MKYLIITLTFISLLFVSCKEKFDFTTINLAETEWKAEDINVRYALSFYTSDSCQLIIDCKAGNCYEIKTLKIETGNDFINFYFRDEDKSLRYTGQLMSKNKLFLTEWQSEKSLEALPKFTRQ
jgi:hypothetical protein